MLGLFRDNGKENENYYSGDYIGSGIICWGYIGIMENKMEATMLLRGYTAPQEAGKANP